MPDAPDTITLDMMRQTLYSAVVCDALDGLGYTHQSPRVQLPPLTGIDLLVGRCKTTLWVDMAHVDPSPYDLELKAVDSAQPDDVMIAAAGGSILRRSKGRPLSCRGWPFSSLATPGDQPLAVLPQK